MRNQVNKMVNTDYRKYNKQILQSQDNNSRKQYKTARSVLGWEN